jgi:hypothetical protein
MKSAKTSTPLTLSFDHNRAEKLKHLLFALILMGVFLLIQSLDQVPFIGFVSHWAWLVASPALAVFVIASIFSPGGDRDWGFIPLVWMASAIPVCGWVFFLIAMPATKLFEMILDFLVFIQKRK